MNLKIENKYDGLLLINIEKRISKLLKRVPQKYLLGLKLIIVVNFISRKNGKHILGRYIPQGKSNMPRIELAIDSIYNYHTKIFILIPFIGKPLLAKVLFHEIGHHYQTEHKQIKKKYWEDYAEDFAKDMMKRQYPILRTVLSPLKPLIRFLKKKINNSIS